MSYRQSSYEPLTREPQVPPSRGKVAMGLALLAIAVAMVAASTRLGAGYGIGDALRDDLQFIGTLLLIATIPFFFGTPSDPEMRRRQRWGGRVSTAILAAAALLVLLPHIQEWFA